MSLYYTLVLFIMILCYGLVFLRFSVMILCYGMGLYRGLALFSIMGGLSSSLFLEYILLIAAGLVSIGFESYVLKVLLTAGQASREPGQLAPEGIPPEGDSDPAQEPQGVA